MAKCNFIQKTQNNLIDQLIHKLPGCTITLERVIDNNYRLIIGQIMIEDELNFNYAFIVVTDADRKIKYCNLCADFYDQEYYDCMLNKDGNIFVVGTAKMDKNTEYFPIIKKFNNKLEIKDIRLCDHMYTNGFKSIINDDINNELIVIGNPIINVNDNIKLERGKILILRFMDTLNIVDVCCI